VVVFGEIKGRRNMWLLAASGVMRVLAVGPHRYCSLKGVAYPHRALLTSTDV